VVFLNRSCMAQVISLTPDGREQALRWFGGESGLCWRNAMARATVSSTGLAKPQIACLSRVWLRTGIRHRRRLHPLQRRDPAARHLGAVRPASQGTAGEGAGRAEGLPLTCPAIVSLARAGGPPPSRPVEFQRVDAGHSGEFPGDHQSDIERHLQRCQRHPEHHARSRESVMTARH